MRIGVAKIRDNIADTLNRVIYQGERVILERRGKPCAAIVSMADLAHLEALDERKDVKAAKRARKEKGGLTLDDLRTELGL